MFQLQNFASVVKDEQDQSAQAQQHMPVLTESAHNIITNITHMGPTVKRAASHAEDAYQMFGEGDATFGARGKGWCSSIQSPLKPCTEQGEVTY